MGFPEHSATPRDMECNMNRNKKLLPLDATLRLLARDLKDPHEFVRAVYANMAGHQHDCQVRLALDTRASFPDYQVEFFIYGDVDGEEVAFPQTAAVFNGRNHQEVTYDGTELARPWSLKAMTHPEIRQLHGELRGILPVS